MRPRRKLRQLALWVLLALVWALTVPAAASGDTTPPAITHPPYATRHDRGAPITVDWTATDAGSGVAGTGATLDGQPVGVGDVVTPPAGRHTLRIWATDNAGNSASATVRFAVYNDLQWLAPLNAAPAPVRSGEDLAVAFRALDNGGAFVADGSARVVVWHGTRLVSSYIFGTGPTDIHLDGDHYTLTIRPTDLGFRPGDTGRVEVYFGSLRHDQSTFTVTDAALPPDPAQSEMSASPARIMAGGSTTATVLVQLRDAHGNPVTTGGHTVALATTLGSLSPVTDHGDGTYSATLSAGPTPGIAVISGTLDGTPMTDTATVEIQEPDPLDLRHWRQEGPSGNGRWTVSSDGSSVVQTINGNPTFFVSPDEYLDVIIRGRLQVQTTSDDDFIGFVIGYSAPLAANGDPTNRHDFLLFDWKQANQVSGGYLAQEGFTLARVDGTFNPYPLFWSHAHTPPTFDVLGTRYGSSEGWADWREYEFEVLYQAGRIRISIDGTVIFDLTGSFPRGRFGFYNYSQANVRYSGFAVAAAP